MVLYRVLLGLWGFAHWYVHVEDGRWIAGMMDYTCWCQETGLLTHPPWAVLLLELAAPYPLVTQGGGALKR